MFNIEKFPDLLLLKIYQHLRVVSLDCGLEKYEILFSAQLRDFIVEIDSSWNILKIKKYEGLASVALVKKMELTIKEIIINNIVVLSWYW